MGDMADFYDVFLSHNSQDKPAVRAICKSLEDAGCRVFFDDNDMNYDEIAGSTIDEALDKTLVFAGCWGPNGHGTYHMAEMDIGFNAAIHNNKSLITVILPGAGTSTPTARFRGFPPIIFSHPDDTAPIKKILSVVDGVRQRSDMPPRAGKDVGGARPATARRLSRARDDAPTDRDPYKNILTQLRRDNRQSGLNFLVGPLSGMEAPTGEDHGDEENLRFPESGEPSPWEVARMLTQKGDFLPDDVALQQLPIELVASWLSMGNSDSQLVQSRLQDILRTRGKSSNEFYDNFAKMLQSLLASSEVSRGKVTPAPMIFTTNFGTNLEWHMMYHGVAFTRVTMRLPDCLEIQSIRPVLHGDTLLLSDVFDENAQPEIVQRTDKNAEDIALAFLGDAVAKSANCRAQAYDMGYRGGRDAVDHHLTPSNLNLDDFEGCILFKYHGSIDIPHSCVVNTEQLFKLTRDDELVPGAIVKRLKMAPSVVFGTSFLLTEVQQAAEAVWRVPFQSTEINRYLVPRDRDALKQRMRDGWLMQLEDAMGENLKHHASKLNLMQIAPGQVAFLEALDAELKRHVPVHAGTG